MDDIKIPKLIVDEKEQEMLNTLSERYEKFTRPGMVEKIGKKAGELMPEKIKKIGKDIGTSISEKELYIQIMNVLADGFKIIEEQSAKCSISEKQILKNINKNSSYEIEKLEEICLVRSYDISKLVNNYKNQDIFTATIEGAGTGWFGFVGLPFNIVLSTFLYFRAVQSIAMYYGYDVKNDSTELVIASEVFTNSLSPNGELNSSDVNIIGKIMIMSQLTAVKQTANKSWSEMVSKGGIPLLLAQMRALANKATQKALQKAGKSGLEKSVFRDAFEQVGRKLTLKSLSGKSIPIAGAIIGGLMDTSQMKKVLEYADIFYHKRFILEKETRINKLIGKKENEIDIELDDEDYKEIECPELSKTQIEILDKYNIDYIFKTKDELLVNIDNVMKNYFGKNDEAKEDFREIEKLYNEIYNS